MSIEELYQNFLETDHKNGELAEKAVSSANDAESVVDGIEEGLHSGFIHGFIAGINFMKGALK